jgi:hypothetical protein
VLPDGKLILSDGRYQIDWKNNKKGWGRKYRDSFTDMQHNLTEEFKSYRIPIVFFNTVEAIEDQVMHSMGKFTRK